MAEAIQAQSMKVASEADGSNAGDQPFPEAKGTESDKVKDLHRDMIDVHSSRSMTTDFGQKVSNTDNWLKIATEKHTGPHLLEDQQAREKASSAGYQLHQLTTSPDSSLRP